MEVSSAGVATRVSTVTPPTLPPSSSSPVSPLVPTTTTKRKNSRPKKKNDMFYYVVAYAVVIITSTLYRMIYQSNMVFDQATRYDHNNDDIHHDAPAISTNTDEKRSLEQQQNLQGSLEAEESKSTTAKILLEGGKENSNTKITGASEAAASARSKEGDDNSNNPTKITKTTTTTSTSYYEQVDEKALDTLLDKIIEKRQIQDATNAKTLLKQIWYKDNSYDPQRDLIVFTHPMKTGGTTLSLLLRKTIGMEVPGSSKSDIFYFDVFDNWNLRDKRQYAGKEGGGDWSNSPQRQQFKSIFSHTPYRQYKDGLGVNGTSPVTSADNNMKKSKNLRLLVEENFPTRRARHIMMLREPLAFVASNFNEWQCRLGKWQGRAKEFNILPVPETEQDENFYGCNGYTVEMLAQVRIAINQKECAGFVPGTDAAKTFGSHLKPRDQVNLKRKCKRIAGNSNNNNGGDHTPECASVDAFLNSTFYLDKIHHHKAYGRCTVTPKEESVSGAGAGADNNKASTTTTTTTTTSADYIEGAIEYLGGLDAPMKQSANGDGSYPNGDMMWLGVTERMTESMCLFHYQIQLPWEETRRERMQTCRPINFWSPSNRNKFYTKEPMMLAVHKAANAVLDLQLAKMHLEVTQLLQQPENAGTNLTYVGEGCLQGVSLTI